VPARLCIAPCVLRVKAPREAWVGAQAAATGTGGPGLLQKLGRVLKEKAAGDLQRVFKGTEKTRAKLGVAARPACAHAPHS